MSQFNYAILLFLYKEMFILVENTIRKSFEDNRNK